MLEFGCFSFLFFVQIILTGANGQVDPLITTEYGVIEGYNYVTPDGSEMEMFLGIPYAKPPINELRFEVRFFKK